MSESLSRPVVTLFESYGALAFLDVGSIDLVQDPMVARAREQGSTPRSISSCNSAGSGGRRPSTEGVPRSTDRTRPHRPSAGRGWPSHLEQLTRGAPERNA